MRRLDWNKETIENSTFWREKMRSFAPEDSKLSPPITIIIRFYESDNFILGWSASDKVLTRYIFLWYLLYIYFHPKKIRGHNKSLPIDESSVQWHARRALKLVYVFRYFFFYIHTGDFSHHYPCIFLATTFEGITIWSMKFISSLHGITLYGVTTRIC